MNEFHLVDIHRNFEITLPRPQARVYKKTMWLQKFRWKNTSKGLEKSSLRSPFFDYSLLNDISSQVNICYTIFSFQV
jgi:hypothetical protein